MAYEVIILGHLHMPLYFLGTFTEYPSLAIIIFVGLQTKKEGMLFHIPSHSKKSCIN